MCRRSYDRQRRRRAREHVDDYAVELMTPKPPPDVIDLLASILTDHQSMPDAACQSSPAMFDWDASASDHQLAVRVCLESCPALQLCRQRAARGDLTGIVGGQFWPTQKRRKAG
jgi:hypothetical protein